MTEDKYVKDAHDLKGLNSDAKAKVQAAKKDGLVAALPHIQSIEQITALYCRSNRLLIILVRCLLGAK